MVSSSAEKERQNAFLVSVIIFFNCCDCSYQCSRVACIYPRGLAGVEKTLSIISACASSQGAWEVIKHGQLSGTGHEGQELATLDNQVVLHSSALLHRFVIICRWGLITILHLFMYHKKRNGDEIKIQRNVRKNEKKKEIKTKVIKAWKTIRSHHAVN